MNLLDLPGPQFLVAYLGVIFAAGLFLLVARRFFLSNTTHEATDMHAYEIAYLAGGPQRAIAAAIAWLTQSGRIGKARAESSSLSENVRHPLDRGVLIVLRRQRRIDRRARAELREPLSQIRERLESQGLLLRGSGRWLYRSLPILLTFAVLGLGLAKWAIGVQRERPTSALVFLIVLVGFFGFFVTKRQWLARSVQGRTALAHQVNRRHALAATAKRDASRLESVEVAMAVALFGASALALGPELRRQLGRSTQSSSVLGTGYGVGCGNGCGSSCADAGCSGGGCGSGCGGCGT